jgi:hypothetical protein
LIVAAGLRPTRRETCNKPIEMAFGGHKSLPFRISRDHPGVASDAANSLSTMM